MVAPVIPDGLLSRSLEHFWRWYERYYLPNLIVTAGLFCLQLVHLYWLTTRVVAFRLLGESFFIPTPFWEYVIIAVDYTEIPALISTSVLYLYELKRRSGGFKNVLYLLFLNVQWLHLFWITDEFVVSQFLGDGTPAFPPWLAWVAIFIDYLELPVIAETIVKAVRAIRAGAFRRFLKLEAKYHVWKL